MATYTYHCTTCNATFDVTATIQEKEEQKADKFSCPKCKSRDITQRFSVVGLLRNAFRNDRKQGSCCSGNKPRGDSDDACCRPQNNNGGCCG